MKKLLKFPLISSKRNSDLNSNILNNNSINLSEKSNIQINNNKINLNSMNINNQSTEQSFFEMFTQIKSIKNKKQSSLSSFNIPSISTPNRINQLELENKYKNKIKFTQKVYGKNYLELYENSLNEFNPELAKKKFGIIKFKKLKPIFDKTKYNEKLSINEFFKKYRNFKKYKNKYEIKTTPSLAFIQSCNEEKIIPNPLGLLKRNGSDSILNLNNQHISNNYLNAISNSLNYLENINELHLSGNRINDNGFKNLFKTLENNPNLLENLQIMDLSKNHIGDLGAEKLSNFLNDFNCHIENLNLEENFLGDENINKINNAIAKNLKYKLIVLNLGNNLISEKSLNSIINIENSCRIMQNFILRNNKLDNESGAKIIKNLKNIQYLKIFDISNNKLGNNIIRDPLYEEIVKENPDPKKKFDNFHLDKIKTEMKIEFKINPLIPKQKRGINAERKLKKSKSQGYVPINLTELKIPKREPSNFSKELCNYFKLEKCSLIHLDISNNNLTYEDCDLISKEIVNNHSLFGIHLQGNQMKIDSLGFISPLKHKNENYFSLSHLSYNFDTDKNLISTKINNIRMLRNLNNCWICEGWREIEFNFFPSEEICNNNLFHIVKIHLSFDDYKPYPLYFNDNKYSIIRMCPPIIIYYFFTVDMKPVNNYGNDTYVLKPYEKKIKFVFDEKYLDEYKNIKLRKKFTLRSNTINNLKIFKTKINNSNLKANNDLINIKKIRKSISNSDITNILNPNNNKSLSLDSTKSTKSNKNEINVNILGKKTIEINHDIIDKDYNINLKYCVPRPEIKFNRFIRPRTPWKYEISIWHYYGYNYSGESEKKLNDCFEHDFNRCHFELDFKNENDLINLKTFLRKNYNEIISCYRTLSSYSDYYLFQISQNVLNEWITTKCNNLLDSNFNINNVFLIQTGICNNKFDKEERIKNNNKLLCDNLVRHQFMSLLVKISKEKYIRTNQDFSNPFEAFEYCFNTHFKNAMNSYDNNLWRIERYYNEKVDNFLKAYLPLFDGVYHTFCKQKGPKKNEIWMVLEEFNNFISSFMNQNKYPIRENPLVFNLSINLQVSEIFSDRHLKMMFPEFLEGMCRAIDKIDIEKGILLIDKLENFKEIIFSLINHPDFKSMKEKFIMPLKNPETGIYIIDYTNNKYYKGYEININKNNIDENEEKLSDSENENFSSNFINEN